MNPNTVCFFLLISLWPLSVLLILVIWLTRRRQKNAAAKWAAAVCLLFALGYPAFLGLNLFCDSLWPYRLTEPSPTGEYALEQRYTDFLCVGYKCRTYLVAGGQYYAVDDIGPGGAAWIDDEHFSVGYSFGGDWYGGTYAVSDFVP